MNAMNRVRVFAIVTGPTALYTAPDGHREHVQQEGADIRAAVIARATDDARRTGTPIELHTRGDHGTHTLLVHPTGTLTPVPVEPETAAATAPEPEPEPVTPEEERVPVPKPLVDVEPVTVTAPSRRRATRDIERTAPDNDASVQAGRASFITTDTTAPDLSGWRAFLARFGVRLGPSAYQVARDGWVRAVSGQWAGCRTIAVVNGKGGVGKTMTTAMLAAVFARHGGGPVLAFDNNDTRGTLGWRTETGPYDTTIRDLLPATPALLDPAAGISEIARFVHHQPADRYDVLRSNPELLATDQRVTTTQFDELMRVAARYYRLLVIDSGNDESSDRWLRMIDHTTQLVIPTLATPESAESAALLLDALTARDPHSAHLAAHAVVVVTHAEPGDTARVRTIADGFTGRVGHVEVIPFDPALKSGPLRFDRLRPATVDAWLRTATATTTGFTNEEVGE